MYNRFLTLFSARLLVLTALLLGWQAAQAAALLEFRGDAVDAKNSADAYVRLSLLSLSDETQSQAVVKAYNEYLGNKDGAAFEKVLQGQETKGYLFTKAAAGYTVRYAWQDANDADRLVLLVTPALKTRNPYLWKTPNTAPEPFSVVELRKDGDSVTMKSSLDSPVEVSAAGQLQLQNYDGAAAFATLKSYTPYDQNNPFD